MLSDATWYPDGVTLGLVLEHFYAVEPIMECLDRKYEYAREDESFGCTRDGLTKHERGWDYHKNFPCNMPNSIEPQNLKGADLQLYRAACGFGLDVQIVPVASLERYRDGSSLQYAASGPLSPSKLAVFRSVGDDPTGGENFHPGFYSDSKPCSENPAEGEPAEENAAGENDVKKGMSGRKAGRQSGKKLAERAGPSFSSSR